MREIIFILKKYNFIEINNIIYKFFSPIPILCTIPDHNLRLVQIASPSLETF